MMQGGKSLHSLVSGPPRASSSSGVAALRSRLTASCALPPLGWGGDARSASAASCAHQAATRRVRTKRYLRVLLVKGTNHAHYGPQSQSMTETSVSGLANRRTSC